MTEQQSHLAAKLRTVDSATVGQMTEWLQREFERTDASLVIGMMMRAGQIQRAGSGYPMGAYRLNREALL